MGRFYRATQFRLVVLIYIGRDFVPLFKKPFLLPKRLDHTKKFEQHFSYLLVHAHYKEKSWWFLLSLPADLVWGSLREIIKLYFQHSLSWLACTHWYHWILWAADQSGASLDKHFLGWVKVRHLHLIFCSAVTHALYWTCAWALLQRQLGIFSLDFRQSVVLGISVVFSIRLQK